MDDRKLARIIVDRMKQAIGAKSQAKLAHALGIQPPSVTDALTKGKIPERWFEIMAEKFGAKKEDLCRSDIDGCGELGRIRPGMNLELSEPGIPADIDKKRDRQAFLELCAKNFEVVFDYIADAYGKDAVGIQNFLDDLRDVHHPYRVWRHEQRMARQEEEKKQVGSGG